MPVFNFQFLVTVSKQTTKKSRVMQNSFCYVMFVLANIPASCTNLQKKYLRSIYIFFLYILESYSSLEQWVFKLILVWLFRVIALVILSICTCTQFL